MKLYKSICTAIAFAIIFPLSTPVYAGGFPTMDDVIKGVENLGDQINQVGDQINSNVTQPVADAIGEGIQSASKMCSQVGVATCMNTNFQQVYRGLKLAASARIINDADTCGALVKTLADGGETAIQAYALYNGVTIPNEISTLAVSMHKEFGYSSCELMYGQQPEMLNVDTKLYILG
ncbi:MAG: hypothetical protein RMX68_013950 [Aulosira sp. ZfuVER01]|nr:hypothetical protein [Aulosira sp. ZfuVER01]MDZ8000189.1 hypothetical protein [Aulosira sp. DedVER01a]MDZ8053443.1 hypothetical protein [Aulosira sp. ZfuCHP01]